ncbi:MAG TPA: hypothetical protein PKC28_01410 [Bdellovibrionales bacterium]|nr:hypothetical protein [Bdellovibrionales bacterium]
MSLEFYRWIHILGLLMLFCGLCALWGVKLQGHPTKRRTDVILAIIHGVGVLLLLVSGFGMLARLGLVPGLPNCTIAKLGIWFLLGVSMYPAERKAGLGFPLVGGWIALGTLAAYLGIFKPF